VSDKTPPSIDNGSFVSWSGGKGRVDLIVRSGKVPGVEGDVEATEDSPAARIVVWEDGRPTRKKIAASTHTLRRIPPIDGAEGKGDPAAELVVLHASHAQQTEGKSTAALSGAAIKAAYDRGVKAWPGDTATILTAEEWGLARARHLAAVAASGEKAALNDADLLSPEHPAHERRTVTLLVDPERALPSAPGALDFHEEGDEGEVTIDADEVASVLNAIQEQSAAPDDD